MENPEILRKASEDYFLPLENNQLLLHRSIVDKHFDPPAKKRRSDYEHGVSKKISFVDGKIQVNFDGWAKRTLSIKITIERLIVNCTCTTPVFKLCEHAYTQLQNLLNNDDFVDLTKFYWPGFNIEIKGKNKFLDITEGYSAPNVRPKGNYGQFYKSGYGFDIGERLWIKQTTSDSALSANNDAALGWCIAYSYMRNSPKSHLPVLIPYLGKPSNDGKRIYQYYEFVQSDSLINKIRCTLDQEKLNALSQEILTVTTLARKNSQAEETYKPTLFSLWKAAFPLLKKESYVHRYYTHGLGDLKYKPKKLSMINSVVYTETPYISFLIKENTDYLSLEPQMSLNGSAYAFPQYKIPFFTADYNREELYMFESFQDEELIDWLSKTSYKASILKKDLQDFHHRFMIKILDKYEVAFIPLKSKKSIPYNIDIITGLISNSSK